MSTSVYITRRRDPLSNSGEFIAQDIWQSLALSDAEFRAPTEVEEAEARRYMRNPSFLVWRGDSVSGEWWFFLAQWPSRIAEPPGVGHCESNATSTEARCKSCQ